MKNKMQSLAKFATWFIVTICIFFSSCGKSRTEFTIGILTNLEGRNAELTITAYNAIKMAYNELISKKAPLKIRFIAMDESFNPVKIRKAYKLLIKNRCDIIFVMTTSTAFLSLYQDVLKNKNRLHFIVGPTTDKISNKNDNVIRNGIDTSQYQSKIASFFAKRTKRLLVLQESEKNKGYTFPAYDYFSKKYKGDIQRALFSAIDLDFTQCINKFKRHNFKYIYIIAGSTPRSVGLLIQKIHMINPNTKIVIMSWVWGNVLKESMGKYSGNVIVPYPFNISRNNKSFHNFKNKLYKNFKGTPNNYANLAYDAAKIVFQALIYKQSTDLNTLKKEILSKSYNGITGEIRFNKYGDTIGQLFFYKIGKDGKLKNHK